MTRPLVTSPLEPVHERGEVRKPFIE
jgi:hypothetical protein